MVQTPSFTIIHSFSSSIHPSIFIHSSPSRIIFFYIEMHSFRSFSRNPSLFPHKYNSLGGIYGDPPMKNFWVRVGFIDSRETEAQKICNICSLKGIASMRNLALWKTFPNHRDMRIINIALRHPLKQL